MELMEVLRVVFMDVESRLVVVLLLLLRDVRRVEVEIVLSPVVNACVEYSVFFKTVRRTWQYNNKLLIIMVANVTTPGMPP